MRERSATTGTTFAQMMPAAQAGNVSGPPERPLSPYVRQIVSRMFDVAPA
jgi:hypothetical protein